MALGHCCPDDRSDHKAIRDGFVSVTPLHPDLTDHGSLAIVEALAQRIGAAVK